ncbi:RNA polymerase sigma-70 factor [Prolixibacteraceae bacterium JC049]|nr:RNA polymerase sigma-70 factor [Prolixibacteraceae bacterium JC049]
MLFQGKKIDINSHLFNSFFKNYFPSLCLFAGRLINDNQPTKDIVQESYIKLWKSKVDFENEKAVRAYLYVLVKNQCFDYLKKKSVNQELSEAENLMLTTDNYLAEIVREETYRMLNSEINKLGNQTKKIIELTLNGYSNKDIANELKISQNTVKTLKLRAYKTLRNNLGKQLATIILTQFYPFF